MDHPQSRDDVRDPRVRDLVAGCLRGDERSLTALISRFQNELLKEFLILDCPREDAEDLVQETLIRSMERLGEYREEDARLRTWVLGIGYRVYREFRRRLHRRRRSRKGYHAHRMTFFETYVRRHSRVRGDPDPVVELWEILGHLPECERLLLHLRFTEELTPREIAGILGMRPLAVRVRIARLVDKIRRRQESRRRVSETQP